MIVLEGVRSGRRKDIMVYIYERCTCTCKSGPKGPISINKPHPSIRPRPTIAVSAKY